MSVFDKSSRYVKYAEVYQATDRNGRQVRALSPAEIPAAKELGEHLRRDGQRLDHLAAHYLNDPMGFWRIAKINDAMSVDVLSNARKVRIPVKGD